MRDSNKYKRICSQNWLFVGAYLGFQEKSKISQKLDIIVF